MEAPRKLSPEPEDEEVEEDASEKLSSEYSSESELLESELAPQNLLAFFAHYAQKCQSNISRNASRRKRLARGLRESEKWLYRWLERHLSFESP